MSFDKIRVTLFDELFASVAEEMGLVLERSSFSANVKERRDYSCALFDSRGNLLAQAAHIPVHLGAMEFLMKRWLAEGPKIEPGKLYISNNPYFAGTHLPDVSVLRSVTLGRNVVGYVASRAHHADIGGKSPGSIAPVSTIHDEGIIIEPQELTGEFVNFFAGKSRGSEERLGDLQAQCAAAFVGAQRFVALAEKYGRELSSRIEECFAHAEALTKNAVREMPIGDYEAEDFLELPSGLARIHLRISIKAERIGFDFSRTDAQVAIGLNATEAVTRSACYYIVRCLAGDGPTNAGSFRCVDVVAPAGSLVNALFPAPVVAGNTETSQRIVDVALQALSKAMPERIPACSQGTMNNIAFGSNDWAYYETIAGGAGAGPRGDGTSGVHTHMTNTRNTPIEALELELPLRILRYELRHDSGGRGKFRGGEGVVRSFQLLAPATCSTMADRRRLAPPGANGGQPGASGRSSGLVAKGVVSLRSGDIVTMETPGGGGWGLEVLF